MDKEKLEARVKELFEQEMSLQRQHEEAMQRANLLAFEHASVMGARKELEALYNSLVIEVAP